MQKQLREGRALIFALRARDVYGRQVGRLLLTGADGRSGVDVAERMIRDGKVFAYDGYLGRCDNLSYTR